MPFKQILMFLSGLLLFQACTNNPLAPTGYAVEKYLMANWGLADVQPSKNSRFKGAPAPNAGDLQTLLRQGLLISFFPDHQFTSVNGENGYVSGTWSYDASKQLLLINRGESVDTLGLQLDDAHQKRRFKIYGSDGEMLFSEFSELAPNYTEDPFFPEHNRWRVPPATEETPEQLVMRLDNYFGHLAKVLKAAMDRKQSSVSFQFSQGIVKIYNGGIGIVPLEKVHANWIQGFYSIQQARDAYELYGRYLQNSTYAGQSTGEWFTDDYNLLLAVQADIKEGRFLNTGKK